MQKKLICIILCLVQLVAILTGCEVYTETKTGKPLKLKDESFVKSGTVAESEGLRLDWDAERLALLIYNEDDELVWSSMPREQYLEEVYGGGVKRYLESSVIIECKTANGTDLSTINSYSGAYENGRIYSFKIENGIQVLYCFDKQCIAIPVEYRLINGYLDVTINTKGIYESGYELYRIHLLPYAFSVNNKKENEILVPDGSGMVMYCDEERAPRVYSGSVYGEDKSATSQYSFTETQSVKLPVYAVSDKDYTYCSIIDKGEEAAEINATAGDVDLCYSYAYPVFSVRGHESIGLPQGFGSVMIGSQYSDLAVGNKIGFRTVFIEGKDNNFTKTAQIYRNYLKDDMNLKEKSEEADVYLDIPMAASKREFVFGVPKTAVKAVTNYEQAANIIKDIYKNTNATLSVKLSGIQDGGLDVTKIAGGYKTESVLGNDKQLSNLLKVAKENKTEIFPDFDISCLTESGGGFSVNKDTATNATSLKASQYFYSVSTGGAVKNAYEYYFLAPDKLSKAAEKLVPKLTKMGFDNVSHTVMGNTYYGDYRKPENYVALSYSENVQKVNEIYNKNKISVMYDSANQYAAINADCIINSPINSSGFISEDEWIPFYQMVFKGYVPMSGASITRSDDARKDFLRSIQCGTGLYFTLCGTETSSYSSSIFDSLSAGSYEDRKDTVLKTIEEGKEAINKTKGETITDFTMLAKGVYKTVFSNDVEIIVNYNSYDYKAEDVSVKSENFIIKGGE